MGDDMDAPKASTGGGWRARLSEVKRRTVAKVKESRAGGAAQDGAFAARKAKLLELDKFLQAQTAAMMAFGAQVISMTGAYTKMVGENAVFLLGAPTQSKDGETAPRAPVRSPRCLQG